MIETTVIRRSDRAVYRKLADGEGGVLLHLDSAAYHGLNETGAQVWAELEQAASLGDVLAGLRSRWDSPPPGWERDVAAFLEELAGRDLVTVEEAS